MKNDIDTSEPPADDQHSVWDHLSRRTREDGKRYAEELLSQLSVSHEDAQRLLQNQTFQRLIVRWAIEFPLNIRWYNAKIPSQKVIFNILRYSAVAIGIAVIVGTTILAVKQKIENIATLGILVAGIFGALQTVAASSDPKTRLGGFRKARADLKESMYSFVERWNERVIDPVSMDPAKPDAIKPTQDFVSALLDEIRTGRKTVREERDAYFGTFKSSTEIMSAATSALDVLKNRRTDLTAAIKDAGSAAATRDQTLSARIMDLRNKLAEATAQRDALVNKMERLKASATPPSPAQLTDLQNTIEDAETVRFKAQALLDMAVKSDIVNPV